MPREFDPDNLTAGDVFRAVAPTIAAIGALILVNEYFPNYVGLAVVALIVLVMFFIWTMPKKDLDAIIEADQRQYEKIETVPLVGSVFGVLRRAMHWLSTIIGIIMFVWLVYWAVGKALWFFHRTANGRERTARHFQSHLAI